MRRRELLVLVCAAFAAGAFPADAKEFAEQIVRQLRRQGYGAITQNRTWLGRTQILATRNGEYREIILDPRTGEILRDFLRLKPDMNGGSQPLERDDHGDNSGHGGGDDDGDDNSGHGGGGSGSGGSGSGGSDDD